jgi:hypothetical protein
MNDLIDEVKCIVANEFKTNVKEIVPCGNHDLNRNLVYRVFVDDMSYVVKVFYKKHKIDRELQVIPLFENENPLRILAKGVMDNGYEWLMYNYIDGWLFDHIIDDLDLDQLRLLFYQIGKKTARLHTIKTFDYFGDWQADKQSPLSDYKAFIIKDCERMAENILSQDLSEYKCLVDAIDKMRSEYSTIRDLRVGRLCHRDLDGRNILIKVNLTDGLKLEAFLDFEKCVVFNEYFDIIGFYRRYFLDQPKLIEPFFKGYREVLEVDESFNIELKFNLYRAGIDICSWARDVSEEFFQETLKYLEKLEAFDQNMDQLFME